MTRRLAALPGIIALLLLAFPTFLTALLLLASVLLVMPTLLLLGPFQFFLFQSVHFESPTHFPLNETHSEVVRFPPDRQFPRRRQSYCSRRTKPEAVDPPRILLQIPSTPGRSPTRG